MKIAIFQEQLYHTEIFGFIFDYLNRNNFFNIDIYFAEPTNKNSYIDFFLSIYKNIIPTFYKPTEITENQEKYDKIIFTTNPKSNFNIKYSNKTIVIIHRIDQFIKNAINIGLSKLIYNTYIQPFFTYNFQFKEKFTKNILIMGNMKYKNLKDLILNIDKFNNYNFIMVSRCLSLIKYINKKNLIFFENIKTEKIIELFSKEIDYLLLLNNIPDVYHSKIISGSVFQAFSFGIPIICDKKYYDIYKYPESIIYNKSIIEILNKINLVNINDYNIMQNNIKNFNIKLIDNNFNNLNNIFNFNLNEKKNKKKEKLINKELIKVKIRKN